MKRLIIALLILLLPATGWGATYFWCKGSAGNFSETAWNTATDCAGDEVAAPEADGDLYVANNQTIAIDKDLGGSSAQITLTTAANGGTAGGGYTLAFPSSGNTRTIYAHAVGGTTVVVTITGAGTGTLNWHGNATGGTATNGRAISDGHTAGTATFTGTYTGGTGTTAAGYYKYGNGGSVTVDGSGVGGNGGRAHGIDHLGTGTSSVVVTGSCTGHATADGAGCAALYVPITVQGNIIAGAGGAMGVSGMVTWSPSATVAPYNYVSLLGPGGDGPAVWYMAQGNPASPVPAVADVKKDTRYGYKADSPYYFVGTLEAGGGAYVF